MAVFGQLGQGEVSEGGQAQGTGLRAAVLDPQQADFERLIGQHRNGERQSEIRVGGAEHGLTRFETDPVCRRLPQRGVARAEDGAGIQIGDIDRLGAGLGGEGVQNEGGQAVLL